MRCAVYARYSSDLQRDSSIEDQVRRCREYAARQGWVVLEDFVRSDKAITGAALAGRQALTALITAAQRRPRPFDKILVDDTSRLARNVADALQTVAVLQFHGVGVTFISQNIDTLDKSARQLVTLNGMVDEQYLVGLGEKVHRGAEGRVLKGLNPGGKLFGYTNVPILNASRPGKYGRPAVDGVEQQIHPQQAEVVTGMGLALIAKTLNAEGVPSPQPPRTRKMQAWCPSSIREMLRNEQYHGVRVWNRTVKMRHPVTGRKVSKARPKEEWRRVEVPGLRIVPEELWAAVQARIEHVNANFGAARLGGLNRTKDSRSYLFSGLLVCGTCGSRLVIISGRGKRGYVRYGCPSHRYRGVCDNGLTIRQDRLEQQLLAALEQRLARPEIIDYALTRFQEQLTARLTEVERQSGNIDGLQQQRGELQVKASRLTDAIAAAGHSAALLSKLAEVEAALAGVDRQIERAKPMNLTATMAEIRAFVTTNIMQLRELLQADAANSRVALARHVGQLTLTPADTPAGHMYEVSGGISVDVCNDVMLCEAVPGHQLSSKSESVGEAAQISGGFDSRDDLRLTRLPVTKTTRAARAPNGTDSEHCSMTRRADALTWSC